MHKSLRNTGPIKRGKSPRKLCCERNDGQRAAKPHSAYRARPKGREQKHIGSVPFGVFLQRETSQWGLFIPLQ